MGGKADAALRRRQTQAFAHRSRQEGIDRRALRPDPFLQPGQDEQIGPHEARFEHTQNAQARMAGAAGSDQFARHEPVQQLAEPLSRNRRQGLAFVEQAREQGREAFAALSRPMIVHPAGRSGRQGLQAPRQGAGRGGRGGLAPFKRRIRRRQGGAQRRRQVDRRQNRGDARLGRCVLGARLGQGAGEARDQRLPTSQPGAAQAEPLQRPTGDLAILARATEPGERVFEDGQQGRRIGGFRDRAGDQGRQHGDRGGGERRPGRGVGGYPPAGQPCADPPRQGGVRRDQGGGPARRLQRLAQQQGRDRGRLFLGAGGGGGQAGEAVGDGVDPRRLALVSQVLDLGQPVGGGFGWAQGLVDQPPPPAP